MDIRELRAQLTKEQIADIQKRLEKLFSGPNKHGRHIVLDRIIDPPVSVKTDEMDWNVTDCPECHGTKVVQLLTSVVPCSKCGA